MREPRHPAKTRDVTPVFSATYAHTATAGVSLPPTPYVENPDAVAEPGARNSRKSRPHQRHPGSGLYGASGSLVIPPVIRNTGSAEPAGHSSAAISQQHSQNDREKIFPASSVQNAGENFTPICYQCGQRPCSHRGNPSGRELFLVKQFLPRLPVAA